MDGDGEDRLTAGLHAVASSTGGRRTSVARGRLAVGTDQQPDEVSACQGLGTVRQHRRLPRTEEPRATWRQLSAPAARSPVITPCLLGSRTMKLQSFTCTLNLNTRQYNTTCRLVHTVLLYININLIHINSLIRGAAVASVKSPCTFTQQSSVRVTVSCHWWRQEAHPAIIASISEKSHFTRGSSESSYKRE